MANTSFMRNTPLAALIALMSVAAIGGCAGMSPGEQGAGDEEGGTLLTLDDTHDAIRRGAHLIMSYDAQANAFIGTVENTTKATLQQVRVEVHLSNGTELGPTTPKDLAAGESMPVRLDAPKNENETFDGWVAHPEVGPQSSSGGEGGEGSGREGGGEHGSGGEGRGERGSGREGGGEHGSGGEGGGRR